MTLRTIIAGNGIGFGRGSRGQQARKLNELIRLNRYMSDIVTTGQEESRVAAKAAGWYSHALPYAGLVASVFLIVAIFGITSFGQTNAVKTSAGGNRFLLVVETSSVMERRIEATLKVVQGLLASGMNGQIHKGDTLGIWTFNDELHAGIV